MQTKVGMRQRCAIATLALAQCVWRGSAAPERHENCVIGAGPGGVQLAYSLQRDGADFVVLERAPRAGAFFEKYPIHRKLISINKRSTSNSHPEFQLRHDWNSLIGDPGARRFTNYTRDMWPHADLVPEYLNDFIREHGLGEHFRFGVDVGRVSRASIDDDFVLSSPTSTFACRNVVVATGRWVNKNPLGLVPGSDLVIGYEDVNVSEGAYDDEAILVLGLGNAALEVADALEETAAVVHLATRGVPRFAHQTHYVGDIRAVNARFLDRYLLKSEEVIITEFDLGVPDPDGTVNRNSEKEERDVWFEFHKRFDGRINIIGKSIEYTNGTRWVVSKDIPALRRPYNRVIRCLGFAPNFTIFDENIAPETAHDGGFPRLTSAYESVNVPRLFFAGALSHARDYRISSGGFIHGFRYLAHSLPHVMSMRLTGKEWPSSTVDCNAEALIKALQYRFRTASSMYQMFSYMGDILILPTRATGRCAITHYKDVPLEFFISEMVEFGAPDAKYIEFSMEWHPDFRGYGALHHKLQKPTDRIAEGKTFPSQRGTEDAEFATNFLGAAPAPATKEEEPVDEDKDKPKLRRWSTDKFLHPILRVYQRSGRRDKAKLLSVHHVAEDVWTVFDHERTMAAPLRAWVEKQKEVLFAAGECAAEHC